MSLELRAIPSFCFNDQGAFTKIFKPIFCYMPLIQYWCDDFRLVLFKDNVAPFRENMDNGDKCFIYGDKFTSLI